MVALVKQNKWALAGIAFVGAIVAGLMQYAFMQVDQSLTLRLWAVQQYTNLQRISSSVNDSSSEEAQAFAVQLEQELENAYAGLSGLPLTDELIFRAKMWHMSVSGISRLLNQGENENQRLHLTELFS